jgi:hypothetical protein
MTGLGTLPAGLEPWGEALNVLAPALANGLLPLLHGLDDLIHRRDAGSGTSGPLDGYDGLATRGTPERILISEWLLAEELPMEFLRRAAQNELLYLAPAYQRPQPRGRVVVLVDNGPDQLGAPRLVQLAALIVLHRRSRTRGADLTLGLLGDEPSEWIDGGLAPLLRAWRVGRSRARPSAATVARRQDELEADDEMWVMAGPQLSAVLTPVRRILHIREGTWSAHGVNEMHVELDGDVLELALPRSELSVRALRGSAFRTADTLSTAADLHGMRDPTFGSAARQLLMRGDTDSEILAVSVSESHVAKGARVRRHRFPGPVLAASYLGRRLVALVREGDELRIRVVGKPLGRLDRMVHSVHEVGADLDATTTTAAGGLSPLYFSSNGIICSIQGTLWRLTQDYCEKLNSPAVAPGKNLDAPRVANRTARGIWVDQTLLSGSTDAEVVLGHGGWCAVSDDRVHWRPIRRKESAAGITVGGGDEIVALVEDDGEPKLVTVSPGGLVLRLVGASSLRTLTAWSGSPGRPAIHPTLPLIAVQRAPDLVEIGHLLTGEVLQVVRGDP